MTDEKHNIDHPAAKNQVVEDNLNVKIGVLTRREVATSQNNWHENLTLLQHKNFSCEIPLHPALRGISQEKLIRFSEHPQSGIPRPNKVRVSMKLKPVYWHRCLMPWAKPNNTDPGHGAIRIGYRSSHPPGSL